MKQVSILINMLLVTIIIFYACRDKKQNSTVAFKINAGCADGNFYGLEPDFFFKGLARYRKTHWDVINKADMWKGTDMVDSRACWYSIDTLKKFICLIEKYSARVNIPSSKLGIRFYYAVYPSALSEYKEARSHCTLFMIPTCHNENTAADDDFNPVYSARFDTAGRRITGLVEGNLFRQNVAFLGLGYNKVYKDMQQGKAETALEPDVISKNQGRLCPPTCPGVSNLTLSAVDNQYKQGLAYGDQ